MSLLVIARGPLLHGATDTEDASTTTDDNNRGVTAAQAGRFEDAATWLRRALQRDPRDPTTRKNLSGVLTDWAHQFAQHGHVDRAITLLQEATTTDPTNGIALVAWADLLYLQRSDLDGAIHLWERANGKVSDAVWFSVANRIAQAKRDQLIERDFSVQQTPHFDIRVPRSPSLDLHELVQWLESVHQRLSQELGDGPSRVTVLMYTDHDLHRLYNQRDWALGFYDGRVRLGAEELAQPTLQDVVSHEVTHAFVQHVYGDRIPLWIHEGFAQFHERARVPANDETARLEASITSRTQWVPLKWLDRRFLQPSSTEDLVRAYVEARVAVHELVTRYGMTRFTSWLSSLSNGQALEQSYDQTFTPSRWAQADRGNFE